MNQLLCVGDTHGLRDIHEYIDRIATQQNFSTILHVGDLAALWPGNTTIYEWLSRRAQQPNPIPIYSCLGNHDNWNRWERLWKQQGPVAEAYPGSRVYAIQRNTLLQIEGYSILFFGGAESIDKEPSSTWPGRVLNQSWWKQETPTKENFQTFFDMLEQHQPDIVVSHECPDLVSVRPYRTTEICSITGLPYHYTSHQLKRIYELSAHKPRIWFYGHHHYLHAKQYQKTTFCCCGTDGEGWVLDPKITLDLNDIPTLSSFKERP
jgi:predicted phosphodiesterase